MAETEPAVHDMVKSVSWLLGKWRTETGQGKYPTVMDFQYGEELEFTHVGQPYLQFSFYAWNPVTKQKMHREVGFVRVQRDSNKVALIIAANNGITEVEEGEVKGQELKVTSQAVDRMSFAKDPAVKKVSRHFKRDGDKLEVVVDLETANTAMTEHLRASYIKCSD